MRLQQNWLVRGLDSSLVKAKFIRHSAVSKELYGLSEAAATLSLKTSIIVDTIVSLLNALKTRESIYIGLTKPTSANLSRIFSVSTYTAECCISQISDEQSDIIDSSVSATLDTISLGLVEAGRNIKK